MSRWIDSVKGHKEQWQHLQDLLERDRLPQALVFTGPSGIGKKMVALSLAQAGVCEGAEPPCGECGPCRRLRSLKSEALLLITSPGIGQLKLEQAREILSFLELRSLSKRRFIVVDDADRMNPAFANALLKILEEPPAGTHFIFLTHMITQLLPTVRSRLTALRFFPLSTEILAAGQSGADEWMLRAAHGSFARLEEWRSESVAEVKSRAFQALAGLIEQKSDGLTAIISHIKERDVADLTARLFQQFFRDVILTQENLPGTVHADAKEMLKAWAKISRSQILSIWKKALELEQDIANNLDRSLAFENFFFQAKQRLEPT